MIGFRTHPEHTPETLALIEACDRILQVIHPASIRAVCYRLFNEKLIRSMAVQDTKRVSKHLVGAREDGLIPWDWIADETRHAEHYAWGWNSAEAFMVGSVGLYRRNPWAMQPRRVELWSEKGTVRSTVDPILRRYGVTFWPLHGFNSCMITREMAQASVAHPKPLHVLYAGDFDPSGMCMSDTDLPRRLAKYGGEVTLTRLALTDEDRATLDPAMSFPPNPKDSRTPAYRRKYGDRCFELDALSPVELRARLEAAIRAAIDPDLWRQSQALEAAERRAVDAFLRQWPGMPGPVPG